MKNLFRISTLLSLLCLASALVLASQSNVIITEVKGYRVIRSNGIPKHETGAFPNRRNPNTISEQNHVFQIPLDPTVAKKITDMNRQAFGVAVNGVPFEPGAAEYWKGNRNSGWQYEAMSGKIDLGFDQNNAHVQPTGSYHYHGMPLGLVDARKTEDALNMVGYAADGFPIYASYGHENPMDTSSAIIKLSSSYRVKKGTRPSGPGGIFDGTFVQDYEYDSRVGDLDECNGRFGITPEYPNGIYHYILTFEYPFIPRHFRGTPDPSFSKKPLPAGTRGGRRPQRRRSPPFPPPGGPPSGEKPLGEGLPSL